MKRRRLILWLLVFLYAVTWIGGWITHARDLDESAWVSYRNAQKRSADWQATEPGMEVPIFLELRDDGPATGVDWCVPILPGVLLADSYQVIGPLDGRGGVRVVFYYGVDGVVIGQLLGWIS